MKTVAVYIGFNFYLAKHSPSAASMIVEIYTSEGQLPSLEIVIEKEKKKKRELISI